MVILIKLLHKNLNATKAVSIKINTNVDDNVYQRKNSFAKKESQLPFCIIRFYLRKILCLFTC
ncbi:hypothetical protein SAMN05444395_1071 [Flavobacterium fryxellicola]|nr:hypothetical protein SAMN05444395_1071 [Flavobacterium fryxellicola]